MQVMSVRIFHAVAGLLLVLSVMAGVSPTPSLSAPTPPPVRLHGHVPSKALTSAKFLGRMASNAQLTVTFALPLRNQTDLQGLLEHLYDPGDPQYGHYLVPQEFTDRFGPTQADYDAVIAYARSLGLTVSGTHPNRLLLEASGPAATIETAFNLHLQRYQTTSGREVYAPDNDPEVPVTTASRIAGVVGLDNAAVRHAHNRFASAAELAQISTLQTGTGPGGGLTPNDVLTAYNLKGVTPDGSGQTLALFELDGYKSSDVASYTSYYALPAVPLQNVLVGGFSGKPGSGASEVTLDIELQIAVAPGAGKIIVYEGPNSDSGVLATYNRIATDNLAKQVSTSWGLSEGQNSSVVINSENAAFQQMAAQGQSIYAASGDSGAYDNGSTVSVDDPASQPYMVAVGGTQLFVNSNGTYHHETTWNVNNTAAGGAGGGGVSTLWSIPSWQQGIPSAASTTMRNVPDVSLNADQYTGYSIYFNGGWSVMGGTSCAAPLWAAFTARVNQKRAANGYAPLGFANPAIYQIAKGAQYGADFHDITQGTNIYYSAGSGYDNATGWGSFNGASLLANLAPDSSFTVAYIAGPNGTISGITPQIIPSGGSGTPVAAIPNAGYYFVNWSGSGGFVSTADNPLTVQNVTSAQTITANFAVAPIPGACGSSNSGIFNTTPATNLCSPDAVVPVTPTGSGWSWDCAGQFGGTTAHCSAQLDNARPSLSVITLDNGAYTNNPSLNITGSANDVGSGIKSVTVNNNPVTLTQNGSFSTLITLTEGANVISVIATDNANNTTSNSRSVTYDKTAPKLTVTAPADNSITNASNVNVSGTIEANSTVHITVNGGSPQLAQITNITDYSATVNLIAGINSISITATDLAGKTATVNRTITSDSVNPELSITAPPEGQASRDGKVTVSGTVSDASSVKVNVNANGINYTPTVTNGSFTQPLTFTEEKLYPVTVTASDQANNSTTLIRNILYSRGHINFHGNPGYTNSTNVIIDLGYYPADPHIADRMQFLYNNKAWTKPEPYATTKAITLPKGDGKKDVTVRFFDESGTASIDYLSSIILDTTAPVGGISIDKGTPQTQDSTLHLNLFATDINGVTHMKFSEDGTVWSDPATFRTGYDYPLKSTTNGIKKIYVRFKDASGKWSGLYSDSIVLNNGWIAPSAASGDIAVKSAKPTDPNGYSTSTAAIVTISNIDFSAWPYMSISTDGVKWFRWVPSQAAMKVSLPGGNGTKTVYARFAQVQKPTHQQVDSSIYSASIILDTTPPVGSILINGGATVTNERTGVTLTLDASDMNGVVGMYVSYDPAIPAVFEAYNNSRIIDLPAGDGVKRVSVIYVDSAGKMSKPYSDSIILDTSAQTGTVKATLIKGVATPHPNVVLSFSANGAIDMQISLDDGTNWGNWEPFVKSKQVTLAAGPQKVQVRFRDLAGNVSKEVTVSISVP